MHHARHVGMAVRQISMGLSADTQGIFNPTSSGLWNVEENRATLENYTHRTRSLNIVLRKRRLVKSRFVDGLGLPTVRLCRPNKIGEV